MKIVSKFKEYNVNIERDFVFMETLISKSGSYFIIDRKVYELYNSLFEKVEVDKLYLLDALEENKNIYTALEICEKLTALPQKRNINLVSIGGGIVQDITGFVANIIYRGINWIFVPTTILAACDSCIGGKTSLNYKNYKNLLGTFFPPDEIFICPDFFNTLTEKDFKSGLGEVVKFNVMRGTKGITDMQLNLEMLITNDVDTMNKYLMSSLEFKKRFIEEDEFDRGSRLSLNYAHTFGHAFESISNYEIPHGTAVALGMMIANKISVDRDIFSTDKAKSIEALCKKIIKIDFDNINIDMGLIVDAIRKDKKQTSESITAVLLDDDFKVSIVKDVQACEIEKAVLYVIAEIKEK